MITYAPVFGRKFLSASSTRIEMDSALVNAFPLTMACWFNADNVTALNSLMWIGDKDAADQFFSLDLAGTTGGDPVQVAAQAGGSVANTVTTTGYVAGRWTHACGVITGAASRTVYIDAGSEATGTGSRDCTALIDRFALGGRRDSTPTNYLDGRIVWPAVWAAALTKAEIQLLATGVPPWMVQPSNLLGCWKLEDETPHDYLTGNYSLTPSGTTLVPAPEFLRIPIQAPWWTAAAGYQAASTFQSAWARGSNTIIQPMIGAGC